MIVQIELTEDEIQAMLRHCHRLDYYYQLEQVTGRVEYEVFDLEGAMGNYEWLVRRIVEKL